MRTTTQNRFRNRGLMQATGIAALSTLAGAADAAIVYSGLQNITLSGNGNALNLDLNNDTTSDIQLQSFINLGIFQSSAYGQNLSFSTSAGGKDQYVTRFDQGSSIGSGTYTSLSTGLFDSNAGSQTKWTSSTPDGYLGFQLSGGEFGWMHIITQTIGVNGVDSIITIQDWAYEDIANAAINAGAGVTAAPEPAAAAMMMLGACALLAVKRRFHSH